MARYLLVNGPNLNLLGQRESAHYGRDTLAAIESRLAVLAQDAGHELDTFQTNGEGALIDRVQAAGHEHCDGILLNPGGFTHTSVALRDAMIATGLPFVEIHLSNIAAREPFRQHSYFSDIALGTVAGFGAHGYELALAALMRADGAA
ncbi:type II 3-dehydroquinate dehydratase [Salinisphaera sp. USBA-960]|uniref:type II 3-dehydroquinate dehydratase n=1 Tax=Salinisphaera orenii TaxID=856731 RepID=UPI000DBE7202|nr:type II 3-dehydroquinate dehydratase [Salifodinibacter halophilus]NNC26949.1 type II 3-dehydroquinate dehydratase [Salifodinibacter halophilus]